MPTSDQENKDIVVRWYDQVKPRSVLDIGAGNGTYSKLLANKRGAHWTALLKGPTLGYFLWLK